MLIKSNFHHYDHMATYVFDLVRHPVMLTPSWRRYDPPRTAFEAHIRMMRRLEPPRIIRTDQSRTT